MKRALTVLLFLSFTIGVCVDGYEVSVTEGDSVTLKSGVTEIQTDDEIEWRFSGSRIATISRGDSEISVWVKADGSFRDRLQLDRQTGDLKIINTRSTDSGEYKVKISRNENPPPEMIFSVKVVPVDVFADEVESVSGLEGYSVTLHTHLTEIQGDDVIQWRYGPQKSPVAEINRKAGTVNTVDTDGRFRDRLKLDQTGSLIIIDTRTTDSGLYEVEISRSRRSYTRHHTQSFSLTVRDVPDPGQSPGAVVMDVVGVVGFLLAATGVIYYCCKKSKKENGQNRKKQDTDDYEGPYKPSFILALSQNYILL